MSTTKHIQDDLIEEIYEDEAFRDSFSTVDKEGKRNWIFAKRPKGDYYFWRSVVAYVVIALLFIGPFLRWEGQPMFLFNIIERKFILFGVTFWPQDFHLFVLAMITFFIFIVLFTVIFGRIWCGWTCPQTVFMEMVFRKIEYWIEGDAPAQRRLAKQPWNTDKIVKKGGKWLIFYAISLLIANAVMSYVVGVDELAKMVTEGPAQHMGKFTFTMAFSGIFFFVFAWFREQACLVVCPYGRLQGVLLGKDSLVVSYDYVRGEPRGKLKKAKPTQESREFAEKAIEETKQGDCVDCNACVAVCPTGIDIRHGTQMECVSCTACIDACNTIMDKVDKPRGLIRHESHSGIENGTTFRFTPRIIAYSVLLVGLLAALTFLLATRSDVEFVLLRTPGTLFQTNEAGNITNLYQVEIVNKTVQDYPLEFRLVGQEGTITVAGNSLEVKSRELAKGVLIVEIPKADLSGRQTDITVEIWSGGKILDKAKASFLGPGLR
ncbi:MAG: cytochrome c oxidase accessory protein CcoG [Bacteroidia bacterium]|nr:cytochrome c oxidase accessory protein CcoG [Bacteroidia bacterium]